MALTKKAFTAKEEKLVVGRIAVAAVHFGLHPTHLKPFCNRVYRILADSKKRISTRNSRGESR